MGYHKHRKERRRNEKGKSERRDSELIVLNPWIGLSVIVIVWTDWSDKSDL